MQCDCRLNKLKNGIITLDSRPVNRKTTLDWNKLNVPEILKTCLLVYTVARACLFSNQAGEMDIQIG